MSFLTLFRSILPSQNGHGDKLPPHVALAEDFASLTRIQEPAINLAILPRRMPDALTTWLNDLPYDELPDGRTLLEGIDEQQLISCHVASNLSAPHPAAACLVGAGKDRGLLLVCPVGEKTSRYAAYLQSRGYKAFGLKGGILSWRNAGRQLIKAA